MIHRDQVLSAHRRQHRQLGIGRSTHPTILFDPTTKREHPQPNFRTLLAFALSSEQIATVRIWADLDQNRFFEMWNDTSLAYDIQPN